VPNSYKQEKFKEFIKHVDSFIELIPDFMPIDLPAMKKLKFEYGYSSWTSALSKMTHSLSDLRQTLKWQSLKELELSIGERSQYFEDLPIFLEIIFNQVRPSVTKLTVEWSLPSRQPKENYELVGLVYFIPIEPERLIETFANLQSLTLSCDLYSHSHFNQLITLLGEYTTITHLSLESHVDLNEDWFIGPDQSNPILLKLTRENVSLKVGSKMVINTNIKVNLRLIVRQF